METLNSKLTGGKIEAIAYVSKNILEMTHFLTKTKSYRSPIKPTHRRKCGVFVR